MVLCSHWQGFYGLHNDDRQGFAALQTVVRRVRELDPAGDRLQWRRCSEITTYACAREMTEMNVTGTTIVLDMPVRVPELTVRLDMPGIRGVTVEDKPLERAPSRTAFQSGTFLCDGRSTLVAFDPHANRVTLTVEE